MGFARESFSILKSLSVIGAILPVLSSCEFKNKGRPNVILIITDDQGYGDISTTGNPVIHTPHLDNLIEESTFFTNYHVDPTSSPSRAALLTGKYAHRVNVWHTVMGGNYLPTEEVTMAEVFKSAGYKTALFGKWHLGGNYPFRPVDQGYETWIGQGDGGTGTATDYWFNDRVNDHYLFNGEWKQMEGYATDVFFNKAIEYIKNANSTSPFFMHLATYVPHNPITIPDTSWVQKYKDKVPLQTAYYYAGIERIDYNLGRLRKELEKTGQARNTILLYMSDNGGTYGIDIFNAGMRGGKGSPYDGGHRVPLVLHWPKGKLNVYREINALTAHVDIFPTLLELCNIKMERQVKFDGKSLVNILRGKDNLNDRKLVVEVQREVFPEKFSKSAVLSGNWRLVNGKELYNVKNDPAQMHDVSISNTGIVKELKLYFEQYWQEMLDKEEFSKSPMIGMDDVEEITLCSEEWNPLKNDLPPWNQFHVTMGLKQEGFWNIRITKEGYYSFIVSRWPLESNLGVNQSVKPKDVIDSYNLAFPLKYSIYNTFNETFPTLNIKAVRLQVDSHEERKSIAPDDTHIMFDLFLKKGSHTIKADFLDENNKIITSAYYLKVKNRNL